MSDPLCTDPELSCIDISSSWNFITVTSRECQCISYHQQLMFVLQVVLVQNKGNIKAPCCRSFVRRNHGSMMDSPHKGTVRWKAFPRHAWHHDILGKLLALLQNWGGGLLKRLKLRSLVSPQIKFLILQKYHLDLLNHIYIWQVPAQLSCGDTCQI